MSGNEAIAAISSVTEFALDTQIPNINIAVKEPQIGFAEMLTKELSNVEIKVDNANKIVRDFALDDSIPIHQVTIALEEARMAVELAMQVRTRLVEGYREIMNMQL